MPSSAGVALCGPAWLEGHARAVDVRWDGGESQAEGVLSAVEAPQEPATLVRGAAARGRTAALALGQGTAGGDHDGRAQ